MNQIRVHQSKGTQIDMKLTWNWHESQREGFECHAVSLLTVRFSGGSAGTRAMMVVTWKEHTDPYSRFGFRTWNKLKNRRTVNTKTRQLGEASSSSMLNLLSCPDQREQEIWGWCIHIQHHELAISIGISTAFLPGDKFLESSEDSDWLPHNTLHTLQPSHAQNTWNSASTSRCTVWGIEKFQRYRAFPTKLCARKRLRSDSMAVR